MRKNETMVLAALWVVSMVLAALICCKLLSSHEVRIRGLERAMDSVKQLAEDYVGEGVDWKNSEE